MSGENRNNVTVKMNGEFWDSKKKGEAESTDPSVKSPRVRIQAPVLPFSVTKRLPEGDDAWERMNQLRGRMGRETAKEPETVPTQDPADDRGEERTFSAGSATRLWPTFPKGPLMRSVITTGGAVAIGLVFGFLVLTVFSQEQLSRSYQSVISETVQSLTAQQTVPKGEPILVAGPIVPGESAGKSAPATEIGPQAALQLPEIKMFVAQAGVFQPDASAQTAAEPLDKQGLPHLIFKDDAKQYMFAAAAPTRDAVLGFASSLKNKGIDVYVKEFAFPAFQGTVTVEKVTGAAANPDLGTFFSNGTQLIQTLSAHSGQIIIGASPALSQKEAAILKEQHRQFLEESRLFQAQDSWKPLLEGMVNGVNQAMAARDKMAEASAVKKIESAESYAWQVQTGVLEYLENYAKWAGQAQKTE